MAGLGVAPHVADKILNHQSGTISGVAAVYQRHEFLAERQAALDLWGAHVGRLLEEVSQDRRMDLKIVCMTSVLAIGCRIGRRSRCVMGHVFPLSGRNCAQSPSGDIIKDCIAFVT
jgi:hypothetical protein